MADSRPFSSSQLPPCLLCYKAGPLRGIWATAPYLHNGSVPNLKQLLLPEECAPGGMPGTDCRLKTFCVGSREFDPIDIGFKPGDGETCKGLSKFDTKEPGNRNTGHLYGTDLKNEERADLLEFLKVIGEGEK